jgi:hypothetical protein
MPSTELTEAPAELGAAIDNRDWASEFQEESVFPQDYPRRAEPDTLFIVVNHGRPAPIILPPPQPGVDIRQRSTHGHRSLLRRFKRVLSPALTALFITYVAIILVTAWIGIRRGHGEGSAEAAAQVSSPEPGATFGPASRP